MSGMASSDSAACGVKHTATRSSVSIFSIQETNHSEARILVPIPDSYCSSLGRGSAPGPVCYGPGAEASGHPYKVTASSADGLQIWAWGEAVPRRGVG